MTPNPPRGVLSLCLPLCLAACASQPPQIVTETIHVSPPEALLIPAPEPTLAGDTNADLVDYLLALRSWGRTCEADRTALRAWRPTEDSQ